MESRRSLLGGDPGFSQYDNRYNQVDGGSSSAGGASGYNQSYNAGYGQGYNQGYGYHDRDGYASSSGVNSRASMTSFFSSKWPRAFFLVTAVQAVICLAFEA